MAQYIVNTNQNIFDIALHLYGSIEGLFDLLITNQDLNMTTELVPGQTLEYHESFVINKSIVDEFSSKNIVPGNGSRHTYFKRPSDPYVMGAIIGVTPKLHTVSFIAAGEGELLVDWGDNSELEIIQLGLMPTRYVHYFDNEVEERRIKLYGEPCRDLQCCGYHTSGHLKCVFTHLDLSGLNGAIAFTRPVIVDKFISQSNDYSLTGLFLFEGTHYIDLQNCTLDNLLPLVNMGNLQELHLENVYFTSVSVLDEYLQALVKTPSSTGQRVGCEVYLTIEPSASGYEAINTILGEDEWNTPMPWKFYINGQLYTLPS